MKKYLALFYFIPCSFFAQIELSEIMKGNEFIGHLPQNIRWEVSGEKICYDLRSGDEINTLCYDYKKRVLDTASADVIFYDRDQAPYERQYQIKDNELSFWDKNKKMRGLLFSSEKRFGNLQRVNNENHVYFQMGADLFEWCIGETTQLKQITNFVDKPVEKDKEEEGFLHQQQIELFNYFSEAKDIQPIKKANKQLKRIYTGIGNVVSLNIHPKGEYVLIKKHQSANQKETNFMSYVNVDGYTVSRMARPKVSKDEPNQSLGVFSRSKDTLIWVDFSALSDIQKVAPFTGDSDSIEISEDRNLFMNNTLFFKNRDAAILDVRSADNKDRWIVLLELKSSKVTELIHEHDEAWIGGPGISSWNMVSGYFSWRKEDQSFLFQSERTGYSHLYAYDLASNKTEPLTTGDFEIRSLTHSNKKNVLYVTCNKTHPGDRNLYLLNLENKSFEAVLDSEGAFEVSVSPDESYLAYRYSSSNQPWELYLNKNKPGATPLRVTKSTTKEFESYNWLKPEFITFKANDGVSVHARVYEPAVDQKNGAAVFFVHGAGYLQNAHHFWSGYFREYMFHNLLVEKGYTVLDLDYRASDGYGRDCRTAIYRYMGGRDLMDYIDAKDFMVENYNIDSNRIGIYGGSYGGFITLMALLTTPEEFTCGAALRSVTDWAHYNHEYTSNILNYPETDSLAYRRSSPIYFAENLKRPLLMLHGMEDNNVQFQDVVRLSQRFIELGKKDWELAVFPVEAHGFKEASSWTDEYRRILELFEKHLK